MARTEDEIQRSLIESLRIVDPSVDVEKGPVYDFLVRPVPVELQKTEADAERVAILSTIQLDRVATQREVEAMATSFSIRIGGGKPSRTKQQQFFTNRQPISDIVIDRGNLVGTTDGAFTYFTTEKVTIPVATSGNFYNPQTRRYEVFVKCEATSVGPDFDLPPTRVSRIVTPIEGIDGTINTAKYSGGEIAEGVANSIDRIRSKFAGLYPETGGGIISDVKNFDPENVADVSLVYPKDQSLFKRVTNRPAIDVHVMGDQLETAKQTYVAAGGETLIALELKPVRLVNSVEINGARVAFSFISDTSRETGGSPNSTDAVLLNAELVAADTVVISYDYNLLINEMQDELFVLERSFDTDILAREPRRVAVTLEVDVTVLSSFDPARVSEDVETQIYELVEPETFIDVLQPEIVRQEIRDGVAGIGSVQMRKFRRSSGSLLDIETIDFKKNEQSIVDQANLVIRVRR